MGILSKSKEKEALVLIFDIGSSSVGGALFSMQKTGIPKMIFSIREALPLEKNLNVDKFLISTLSSLKIVASKMHITGKGAPESIFCVLSSPWYVSQTRFINLEKNTTFIFTPKLADDLIKKEVALFEEENRSKYEHLSNEFRTIELKNIQISLNGYETSKPLNQKAKMLEMTIFVSISPLQVVQKMEDVISQFFHLKDLKFISSSLSSFVIVRDLFINKKNFLLVNIGGELTDIEMVKKDILRESISYPLGVNFIIRDISKNLLCTLDEAKSFLSLYRDGHASPGVMNKLEPIINNLKNEWLKKFQESLSNLSNDISIPADIFIIVEKDWANFFTELIKNEQFNQYTLTESKFQITVLGTETLHGVAVFEDNVIRDPFLIIEAIYINQHIHEIYA